MPASRGSQGQPPHQPVAAGYLAPQDVECPRPHPTTNSSNHSSTVGVLPQDSSTTPSRFEPERATESFTCIIARARRQFTQGHGAQASHNTR
jgi:hypothetical protein